MPVVYHDNVPSEPFRGGATYQTVVGDQQGSTPVRLGIQTSPPGYRTPLHSHPYMEALMILEGAGEAWIEGSDDLIALAPGMTLVFPAERPPPVPDFGRRAAEDPGRACLAPPDRHRSRRQSGGRRRRQACRTAGRPKDRDLGAAGRFSSGRIRPA